MRGKQSVDLARRFEQNPLLKPADVRPSEEGMTVECLLNPGVFRFEKQIWLLIRAAERPVQKPGFVSVPIRDDTGQLEILHFDRKDPELDHTDPRLVRYHGKEYLTTLSHLRLMCSTDGKSFVESNGYDPIIGKGPMEAYGIEDCRVAEIDGLYHLTYTMVSPYGVAVGLIQTRDWKHYKRRGMIFPPHNKDCAIFESKINDKYYALHRPSSPELGGNYICLASSPDLIHWGHHVCLATTRPDMWDSVRVGGGCSPIRTGRGWLCIYHGADEKNRYCLGGLLLDLENPSIVKARSITPIMAPKEHYELNGFFGNVVFTNGHLVNGDLLRLYYGSSDEVICGAELSIQEIFDSLEEA